MFSARSWTKQRPGADRDEGKGQHHDQSDIDAEGRPVAAVGRPTDGAALATEPASMASTRSVTGAPLLRRRSRAARPRDLEKRSSRQSCPDQSDPAAGQRCSRTDRDPLTFAYVTWRS